MVSLAGPGWTGQIDRIRQPRSLAFLKNPTISLYMLQLLNMDKTRKDVRIARLSFLVIILSAAETDTYTALL